MVKKLQPEIFVSVQEIYVSIWAKAVDTQMHFNEMAVKSRQFGSAFVAADAICLDSRMKICTVLC